jgi:Mrp family chromosome partitioning ATPase
VVRYAVQVADALAGRQPASWTDHEAALRTRRPDSLPNVEVAAQHTITAGDPRLPVAAATVSRRAASFRVLRPRIVERGDPRVVLVTSALDGDGKSTVAVNLAAALAESGQSRVLLLEADVRRPGLAKLLCLRPPACLLDQLQTWRTNPRARWSVIEVLPSGLHLMAIDPDRLAGRPSSRGFHGPTFTRAIAELRRLYDYIVVDAPSVLTSMEVNLVEDGVSGILFVARGHETRGRDLRRAVDQVSPGKVIGVVLIDT